MLVFYNVITERQNVYVILMNIRGRGKVKLHNVGLSAMENES